MKTTDSYLDLQTNHRRLFAYLKKQDPPQIAKEFFTDPVYDRLFFLTEELEYQTSEYVRAPWLDQPV